ncbi:hypothetical protein MIZ03_0926 [Rhodoferax lithotrophicus]|uniref:Uncharacterized protein n=1 Tax=Rhodoferax lithotrophicus TaxID=2798804 RepID=A0ABN6D5B2_9BURK|nr:hypothetical protein MIZ03_0926 [Rhodoferax sp. MIZ03]
MNLSVEKINSVCGCLWQLVLQSEVKEEEMAAGHFRGT